MGKQLIVESIGCSKGLGVFTGIYLNQDDIFADFLKRVNKVICVQTSNCGIGNDCKL